MTLLRNARRILCGLLPAFLLLLPALTFGQNSSLSLSGQVLDPSGAAVPALDVTLVGSTGTKLTAQTDEQGKYAFRNLTPGTYTLTITLQGFEDFSKPGIVIARGKPQVVNAQLAVAVARQQITVTDQSTKLSVNPEENASALVLQGKDLESLSDDPDELQSELEALAGPSAGPNGGQIYIDGFSGGQLPPKNSIREIRVNQNPFSAQYDALGYGRVEILTKPGSEKFHGSAFIDGNTTDFNTRNPFATEIPGYHSEQFDGSFGGPINKKSSFYADGEYRDIEDDAIVNAIVLGTGFNQTSVVEAVPTPQTRGNFTGRYDTQLSVNNTLTLRYQLWKNDLTDSNIGNFTLPSAGYNLRYLDNVFSISDAQVINSKAVTEVRFRYYRDYENIIPASTQPTLSVSGAFTGGGTGAGLQNTLTNTYQFQDYTSVSLNKNFVKFGARFDDSVESATSTSGFNGAFTFNSIQAYQITQQGLQSGLTPAQIQANGGGASQFSLTSGFPLAHVNYFDFEPYIEDDWKARPNLTISAGLRVETQDHISDHADFAPRLGIAWGLGRGKSTKTVLRTGYGIFYDRFGEGSILNAERFNGINQQDYIVENPTFFPNIPSVASLSANLASPTIYQIAPNLRTPYTSQGGMGLERQITKKLKGSVTYLNTHGTHQLIMRNINAPDSANPGDARPNPNFSNLYQYESAGIYNQNQMIANFNFQTSKFSIMGFYTLSYADTNTNGGFPSNQYDVEEDYGRAPYDVRNRLFLSGSWNLPHGFQLFPFVVASSAAPFNITLGQDLNGDSIYNDRPAFATSATINPVSTPWGKFDLNPAPGTPPIPVDLGTGFNHFTTNLRLSKTFGFGKEVQGGGNAGGGGGYHGHGIGGGGLSSMGNANMFNHGSATNRRFALTFSVSARNLFNNVNFAAPEGVLSSPLFGKPYALSGGFYNSNAANRRIDFQVRFSF